MGSQALRRLPRPRRIIIYAVIRSGGKQYRVERDQLLDVDRIDGDVGSTVELKEVLLVANNGDVQIGAPTVEGAVVEAEIVEHARDKKLRVFKYKNKTRYRRRIGHRTHYTRLAIKRILQDGKETVSEEAEEKPKPKRPSRRAKKPAAEAKAEEPATETAAEAPEAPAPEAEAAAPEVEAPAKPKRATKRTTTRKAEAEGAAPPEAEAEAEEKKPARKRSSSTKASGTARRRTAKKAEEKPDEEKADEEPGG